MSRLKFSIEATASGTRARAGRFTTLHNEVETPVFMPVGTKATVRGQRMEELHALGFPILLANTYHLLLRPGPEVFRKMGGIQKFMGWKRSVLTDSGGFQIFSLPNDRVMSETGALFKSYVDNREHLLTPETSIEMQKAIGSDIMMALDQCIPSTSEKSLAENAMHLTHRWAKRSLLARGDSPQSLFGIVQGACFEDLRKESAKRITDLPFDGFAIGGLAVGETKSQREQMTELTTDLLPKNLPRYLMGVGTPLDILEAVHRGVDMFDCILPMVLGQQGVAFTNRGKVDTRRGAYRYSEEPLEATCPCIACTAHSIAYLHYLIRVKEDLGRNLIAAHNLHFYARLMREIRNHLLADTFLSFYKEKREAFSRNDRNFPANTRVGKKNKPRTLGDFTIVERQPGVFSIQHLPSGETMHSINKPDEEAHSLYVEQSNLVVRLQEITPKPFVIWDVGLGAAHNAMAVIRVAEKSPRPLHLYSFENNLDSLCLGLKHHGLFPHLWHVAPPTLLKVGGWENQSVSWKLIKGDFFQTMYQAPKPDLILFDPFSFKTDVPAWTYDSFRKIFATCRNHDTELYTYSSATSTRGLLLSAGFYVAKGIATGPKSESTIALTPLAVQRKSAPLLPIQWLQRWEKSHAKFPPSIPTESHEQYEQSIRKHPQFLN